MDDDLSALRSVAHPVRLRILSMLTAEAMSAADVARELGLTHANASYHLRVLLDAGELVVESEEKIRGGVAKRYRYVVGDHAERSESGSSPEDHIARQLAISSEVVRRLGQRVRGPGNFSDIETWVTPEAWQAAIEAIAGAMIALHEQARPPRTDGTIHVSATATAFVMASDPEVRS